MKFTKKAFRTALKANDIKATKIELERQVGASIKDNSRFGGLNIYYLKKSW